MSTLREIANKTDSASEPATYPAVSVPRPGEKFSDEELHARFNVPVWGRIRVSLDKKCIVLVGHAADDDYEDVDHGRTLSYMGQNLDREGMQCQEILDVNLPLTPSTKEPADPLRRSEQAATGNCFLSRSKGTGYTVLYFTRGRGAGDLEFDSRVECDSHRFEVEQRAGRPPRVVIKFELRRVGGAPCTVSGRTETTAAPHGDPDGWMVTAVGRAAPRGGAASAGNEAPVMLGSAGHVAGILGGARRAIGGPPRVRTPFEEMRRADRPSALLVPRVVQARPEVDNNSVGMYMQDAIERGGYRAALHYYSSDEAKKSNRPCNRLRARGWLLGRLGLYDQMGIWLDEASEWDEFDSILAAACSGRRVAYRPPALWLQTPTPMPRSEDRMVTLEPAAEACRDTGAVPDYIWTTMLILDAAGPICSRAGLGAAAFLVAAGAARRDHRTAGCGHRYDPRRSARLDGAPEGCHRWIIADIDFNPHPINRPRYYYDLTDEGRETLAAARSAGAPWAKATESAALSLGGMALPELLEDACCLAIPTRGLDAMRYELGRLVDAWRAQDNGKRAPPVDAKDQVLVDLGQTEEWPETGGGAGSSLDLLYHIMAIVNFVHSIACEARPSTGAEGAVLRTLIGTMQDMCRIHGEAVAAIASQTGPSIDRALCDPAWQGVDTLRWPMYPDATPAMISDLYYCLVEYCRSRRLAADPCGRPLYEVLTEDERAV